MRFYPFFLECSKRERMSERKRELELLAFGKCGMIIDNEDGTSVLIKNKNSFVIPKIYTDKARDILYLMLWDEDNEFDRMASAIKESIKQWANVKKRDKLRIIDKYVLQLECDIKEKKLIKSVITIALILRMIQTNDIVYQDFEIKNIEGTFDCNYFINAAGDPIASKSSRSHSINTKISAKDIWKKVYGRPKAVSTTVDHT